MQKYFLAIAFTFMLAGCATMKPIERSQQLIVVVTSTWDDNKGTLFLFDKTGEEWKSQISPAQVSIGKSGLAWGVGLHKNPETGLLKQEGDKRSPAGIFEIGGFYGWDEKAPDGVTFPYKSISSGLRCVDDDRSKFYNQIVEESDTKDWSSAERMKISDYKLLLVVNHNVNGEKKKGSCIFMHLNNVPTSGCTTMNDDTMLGLLKWLDVSRKPLLVQLPITEYQRFQNQWNLPTLPTKPYAKNR